MRHIYSLIFYLLLPFILLRLYWKGRKSPYYRKRWWERLGFVKPLSAKGAIWVHAVSLGEMVVAKPLIQAIRTRYPTTPIAITNMTATGAKMAEQLKMENVFQFYVPYDLPDVVKRFVKRVQPRMLIIMETELWPNLIHYTSQKKIPILLANGRLSEKSMLGYLRIRRIIQPLLSQINFIAVQTQIEAERFIKLGASPQQVVALGSIKFDIPIPEKLVFEGRELRKNWRAESRPILLAASTHNGEEEKVLNAFSQLKKIHPSALLILVPRHPERFDEVVKLGQKYGYQILRRSEKTLCNETTDIFVGDSFGEMFLYFSLSDIAFIGGSLANIGGHNLLEPAALALPIITGTHVFNFAEIFALLNHQKAVLQVHGQDGLFEAWKILLEDKVAAEAMGERAKSVVLENQGALAKHMAYVEQLGDLFCQTKGVVGC
ncbi:MAG: Three-deoxy-D-manno-octulosonic-acid transferase domain protein [Gammaproteobacteria bacterium]|jgi:3-deoxy-D-manno-octulosonic-acid transferase|nr:Three-deoxy-D-manno-octulosonic-acid transferase domain protein [Gammaproteobacteria bacterium]